MHSDPQPSAPARNRLPTLPRPSLAGWKFQSRNAISDPASAAGKTASGNQPKTVSASIRPSIAAKAVPQTKPSTPSEMRTHSASATSPSSQTSGASTPSST